MTLWWHTDQDRLRAEKEAIADLQAVSPWLENLAWELDDRFRLTALFEIALPHERFSLRLTYYNTFPSSPPSVAPTTDIRVSGHQYGKGGDLCLQFRPDNWRPEFTGANLIESAYTLLSSEAPDEDGQVVPAPADHDVPEAITMRGRWCRFYATPALSSMLAAEGQTGAEVKLQLHWCDRAFVVAVVKSVFHQGAFIPVPDVPTALGDEGFCASGQLVRCDRPISKIDATEVIALHEFLGVDDLFDEDRRYCLIVDNAAQLLLIQKAYNGEGLVHFRTVYQPSERSRHGDEYAFLSEKRVGIIGVGSLGSKVAVSLARAGVGRFELVDGDILHADNLERHDADWRDVGLHKADLTARRLKLVHRNVDAHTWRTAIGAQVSNSEAGNVDAALAGCDLIVDATAKADAFNHLAGLAGSANKVLVWGSMYAGGVGGEVARSRPALDPSPFDVRDAIAAFAAASEAPPPRPEGAGYDGNVEGTHWTASDADVCAIASTVSSLALDALIKREPSRFDAHGYIIGLDRAWIFSGPFHVQPIIADAPFRTDVSPPEQSDAEREFIGALMKKKLDEVTDRADGDRRLDRFAPESSS